MSAERIGPDDPEAQEIVPEKRQRTALEKSGGFSMYDAIAGQYDTVPTETIIRAEASFKLMNNMRGAGRHSK
jgi:hypothetical protein